jgi:hypothetical protein
VRLGYGREAHRRGVVPVHAVDVLEERVAQEPEVGRAKDKSEGDSCGFGLRLESRLWGYARLDSTHLSRASSAPVHVVPLRSTTRSGGYIA